MNKDNILVAKEMLVLNQEDSNAVIDRQQFF